MNLGLFEDHLVRVLRATLGAAVEIRAGPVARGPATGLRAQVFVHAAAFADAGGITADGARVARQPLRLTAGRGSDASGYLEQRPATLDFEITCLGATHAMAQALAGWVAPAALEALETLAPPQLGNPADALRRLRFADMQAHVRGQQSSVLPQEVGAAARVVVTLRVEGFLHVLLARPGGLVRRSVYELPLRLEIVAGNGLKAEHARVHNDSADVVDLGGWSLHDTAAPPKKYTFAAACRVPAGGALRLWSGSGTDDAGNVYWGRRRTAWNRAGDGAALRDPDGVARAHAAWNPPKPPSAARAPRKRSAR